MLRLTPREEQIAALIILGYRVEQMAAELGISKWTVRDHIREIGVKCQVTGMREIAAVVLEARDQT